MATTSLWHIKGRLKDLIDYVENPEKTVPGDDLQDFLDVFSYVRNPEKTDNGEYVSAVNCLKETALEQMILTKKQYQKSGGYIAWHGYQSFKPNEVTPEQCHKIGLKLAGEMWGDKYQIIVTTHLDKEHLHNHFCFNSVSFIDGRKYDYSKSEQKRLREVWTGYAGNTDYRSSNARRKPRPDHCIWMKKAESRHATMSIWRIWQKQSAAAVIYHT